MQCRLGIHHILRSLTFSSSLNLESIWGQRHIIFIPSSCCLWGMILELEPDAVRARMVTYYALAPPPSILLNICCAGIDSSSRDPGKRVVLGHRCHSSISRKYLRPRVKRWGARSRFIIWWERPRLHFGSKRYHPTSALVLSHIFIICSSCKISISLLLFLRLMHSSTTGAIIRYEENVHVCLSGIQWFKKEDYV